MSYESKPMITCVFHFQIGLIFLPTIASSDNEEFQRMFWKSDWFDHRLVVFLVRSSSVNCLTIELITNRLNRRLKPYGSSRIEQFNAPVFSSLFFYFFIQTLIPFLIVVQASSNLHLQFERSNLQVQRHTDIDGLRATPTSTPVSLHLHLL